MLIKKQNSKGIGFCLNDGLLLHKYLLHVQDAENIMCGSIYLLLVFSRKKLPYFYWK